MTEALSYTIRKAVPEDAGLLSLFASRAFFDAYAGTMNEEDIRNYIKKSFREEEVLRQLSSPVSAFHLMSIGNEAVGYTKLRWDRVRDELAGNKAIELERIYVDGKHYRSGLGTALFDHVKIFGKDNGYDVLWLAVWQKNFRAISFYRKSGMEIFGVQQFIVGTIVNDDYVFKLVL